MAALATGISKIIGRQSFHNRLSAVVFASSRTTTVNCYALLFYL